MIRRFFPKSLNPRFMKLEFIAHPRLLHTFASFKKNPQETPTQAQSSKEEPKISWEERIDKHFNKLSDELSSLRRALKPEFIDDPEFKQRFQSKLYYFVPLTLLLIYLNQEMFIPEIDYNTFLNEYFKRGLVKNIEIVSKKKDPITIMVAIVTTRDFRKLQLQIGNPDQFIQTLEQWQVQNGITGQNMVPIYIKFKNDYLKMLDKLISTSIQGIIAYQFISLLRAGIFSGGAMGSMFGKKIIQVFGKDSKIQTKFSDVAGLQNAKHEIVEFVDFLKWPQKYTKIGAKLPKGALLTGPPGTGKTLLAKACAGEAGVPFFFMSGSDFVEMFVGVGAQRVRDLFAEAKKNSPSIIFIDEIDAVGKKRESKFGGSDEKDNTLNQLLVEMDGFKTDSNVIVMAATNRPELLDPALTRPGRFDRQIEIQLPDIEARKEILLVHLAPIKLDPSKSIENQAKRLATLTPGFSGADLSNLCNEAAIMAARRNSQYVEKQDFEEAAERVIAGLEKKNRLTEKEKRVVAVHESGHAVVSWFLKGGHPLIKVTIKPRSKGSLGYAQYLPNENSLDNKEELIDRLSSILGGRQAEEIFFGSITTGAYDDLKKVYEMSYSMITKLGMSEKIGYIGYEESQYKKTFSDRTNKIIDDEVRDLIRIADARAREIILLHKDKLQKLSEHLYEKESLDLVQLNEILGERPFIAKSNYKAFLEIQKEQATQ